MKIEWNYLEIDVDCLKEDKKEFVKNKLILKTQQRFQTERQCFYWSNYQDFFKFK